MTKAERQAQRALEALARAACPAAFLDSGMFVAHWDRRVFEDPLSSPELLLQVAAAAFLDKPIIIMLPRGVKLPRRVKRLADHIIWIDVTDPDQRAAHARAQTELMEVLTRLCDGPPSHVTLMDMQPQTPTGESDGTE